MGQYRFLCRLICIQPVQQCLWICKSLRSKGIWLYIVQIHQSLFYILLCHFQLLCQHLATGTICHIHLPQPLQSICQYFCQNFRLLHIRTVTAHYPFCSRHQQIGSLLLYHMRQHTGHRQFASAPLHHLHFPFCLRTG